MLKNQFLWPEVSFLYNILKQFWKRIKPVYLMAKPTCILDIRALILTGGDLLLGKCGLCHNTDTWGALACGLTHPGVRGKPGGAGEITNCHPHDANLLACMSPHQRNWHGVSITHGERRENESWKRESSWNWAHGRALFWYYFNQHLIFCYL